MNNQNNFAIPRRQRIGNTFFQKSRVLIGLMPSRSEQLLRAVTRILTERQCLPMSSGVFNSGIKKAFAIKL